MNSKQLLILGMHRSGTSLISHWLLKCGLHIGECMAEGSIGNQEGFFEDLDFVQMHEQIFISHNMSPYGYSNSRIETLSDYEREKLISLLNLKSKLNFEWGFKDPRTCLFLKWYRTYLPNANYLIIIRNFSEVVDSLVRRDFKLYENRYLNKRNTIKKKIWTLIKRKQTMNTYYKRFSDFYLKIWLLYNKELLLHIKTIPRESFLVTKYSALLSNSTSLFSHLNQKWNYKLNSYDFENIFKEHMMSREANIEFFVNDKRLIAEAKEVELELSKFLFPKLV